RPGGYHQRQLRLFGVGELPDRRRQANPARSQRDADRQWPGIAPACQHGGEQSRARRGHGCLWQGRAERPGWGRNAYDQDRQDDGRRHGLSENCLPELAAGIVKQALAAGASDAECAISEGEEFSANVRMRELETLKEAGSRGVGLRILIGKRTGSAYTSDFSADGIRLLVRQAIELAEVTTEDPHLGLPDPDELGSIPGDLALYCGDLAQMDAPFKIGLAKEAEAAALDADPRITNSEGGSFDTNLSGKVFANWPALGGEYGASNCSLSAVPVARDGASMERDYWYSMARSLEGLEKPADIGRIAAQRAVRRLGAVKVETQKVPVVFE